jgi:hypothetical protein
MTPQTASTLALASLFLFAACSKSDESPTRSEEAPPPPSRPMPTATPNDDAVERIAKEPNALDAERAPAEPKPLSPPPRVASPPVLEGPAAARRAAKKPRKPAAVKSKKASPRKKSAPSAGAKGTGSVGSLTQAVNAFDNALGAERLSCAGARPHRDAICTIAERLCGPTEGEPTATDKELADCEQARTACVIAQARYRDRCGSDD